MTEQKRVLAIHDISGIGKCSLTVALPIISAMGIETSVLPTAILSTHTGGFENFTYRDLTDDLLKIAEHWKTLDIKFDGFYTGYLGSFKQVDIVSLIIKDLKDKDSLIIVDPVMADNGVLYAGFSQEFPLKMRELVAEADVIIPNITEAVLLLEKEYKEGPYTKDYIEGLLKELGQTGAKKVILTGVYFNEDELGTASYDVETGQINYCFRARVAGHYHGTGDVFGSVITGALINGKNLSEAVEIATDVTVSSIQRTKEAGTDPKYGVNFEASLQTLIQEA